MTLWLTVVGVGVPVAVVDQQRIVVDAIKQVDHLVHGEFTVAIVIQQTVEGLKLLDVQLLHPIERPIRQPLGMPVRHSQWRRGCEGREVHRAECHNHRHLHHVQIYEREVPPYAEWPSARVYHRSMPERGSAVAAIQSYPILIIHNRHGEPTDSKFSTTKFSTYCGSCTRVWPRHCIR